METRLLIESAGPRREPDRSILQLLAQSRRFNDMIMRGDGVTIAELAKQAGVSPSYFTRILRLSFLAPRSSRRSSMGAIPRSSPPAACRSTPGS